MEKDFNVSLEGTSLIIKLGETLGISNAPVLMEELNTYKGQGVETVVFDATDMNYISSSGIRTVLFAKQKLEKNPVIIFVNCKDDIRNVFVMTGLQNYIEFQTK